MQARRKQEGMVAIIPDLVPLPSALRQPRCGEYDGSTELVRREGGVSWTAGCSEKELNTLHMGCHTQQILLTTLVSTSDLPTRSSSLLALPTSLSRRGCRRAHGLPTSCSSARYPDSCSWGVSYVVYLHNACAAGWRAWVLAVRDA